jgi:hypothetical protein
MIDQHNLAIELIAALRTQPYALSGDLVDRVDSAQWDAGQRIAAKESARNLSSLAALLTAQTVDEKSKPVSRIELYVQKQVEGSETRHLCFVAHADVSLDGALTFAPDADLAEALKAPCFGKICPQDAPAAEAARHHPIVVLGGRCFIQDVLPFYKEALSSVGQKFQSHGPERVFVVKGVRDWSIEDGSRDPLPSDPSYDMRVSLTGRGVLVDVAPSGSFSCSLLNDIEVIAEHRDCLPHLTVGFEINGDLPCAHVYSGPSSELVQSLFGASDALVVSRPGDVPDSLEQLPIKANLSSDLSQEAVHRFAEQRLIAALLNGAPDLRGLSNIMARYEARLVDKHVLIDEAKDFLSSLDPQSSAAIKLAGLLEPLVETQPLADRPRGG